MKDKNDRFVAYPHREYLGGQKTNLRGAFMVDDKVNYNGGNEDRQRKLGGRLGIILARVVNSPTEYVVDFGDEVVIVEERELVRAKATDKMPERPRRKKNEDE